MKKLNQFRKIGLGCLGVAVIFEVIGALTKVTALSIVALVILLGCIAAYLILYKCPYCGKFPGGRYGDAIKEKNGEHICPYCNHSLD